MKLRKFETKKLDTALLSVCSTIPVFAGASVAAEGGNSLFLEVPKSADNSDVVAAVNREKEVVVSPISQPDDLSDTEMRNPDFSKVIEPKKIQVNTAKIGKEEQKISREPVLAHDIDENKSPTQVVSSADVADKKIKKDIVVQENFEQPLKDSNNQFIDFQNNRDNLQNQTNIAQKKLDLQTEKDEKLKVAEKSTEIREVISHQADKSRSIAPPESNEKPEFKSESETKQDIIKEQETEKSISSEQDSPDVRIITPVAGETTNKTTNLAVQFHPSSEVKVTLNGKLINSKISSYLQKDEANQLHTQIWYNLPLENGVNIITAETSNGKSTSVQITVKEQKAKIVISPINEARIPADGRSRFEFTGKIINEKGEIIPENAIATLSATAGKFLGTDQDHDAPGFQVQAINGKFSATLQAPDKAENVQIRASVETGNIVSEAYTNVEFITNLRPSLATGVINLRIGAGGTNYWGSNRDFLNPQKIGSTDVDLNAAVFATGKVGDWLFTGAFNSQRSLNEDCNGDIRLFGGVQDCEKAYPVYGDASTVTATTPSTDSVYAKFERTPNISGAESDYFMWGDYNTSEFARTSQLFTATTRQLHGFKGNYNLGNLQVTGMFANNIQGFQRDTISPNGTSGYYFLSRRLVIPGSEDVFIESEEINRPGTVVKRKALSRGADYEIDYDRGTLLFRSRIFSTELNPFGSTLANRIVVTYQNDKGSDSKLYGGRVQYNFRGEQGQALQQTNVSSPFIAATYLNENQGEQDFQLYGADFFFPLGNSGQIVGEYGRSHHNSLAFGNVSGSAYRLEAFGKIAPNLSAQAYYRSVTENFANNATWSFAPGLTRYGASVNSKITDTTSFNINYDKERNFGIAPAQRTEEFDLFNPQPLPTPGSKIDNSLETFRAGIQQKLGNAELGLEFVNRSRNDRINQQFSSSASQLVSKASIPLSESLTFQAQNETNLGKADVFNPNRTTLGLDWALYPGINMRLAHQFFDGGVIKGNSITSLDTTVEHKFSEDTSLNGRYSIFAGSDGMSDRATVGLNHRIRLAPGLKLNLGYERIQNNIFGNSSTGIRFAQPYTTGQSAFSLGFFSGNAYSIGLDYTDNPNFQANARFEYRDGKEANNMVISANATGKISPALTAAARYQQAGGANQLLGGLADSANLRVGLAYRDPSNDKFNGLLSYEYRQNLATIPDDLLLSNGNGSIEHLFAAEAIYAPDWRWEFYGKYALRNATSYLANNFTNSSSVHLAQVRASYQLGYRTDVAVEGRWRGQPTEGFNEFGIALEGGYHITPDFRVGLGYAFGSADDRDFTGYRSAGGPYLNLTYKINELFGGFGRQKPAPPQQQESTVKTVVDTSEKEKTSTEI
ncbi:hypothetical protein NIES4101_57380 [Calothrix sp. NIES-4101]|nr:hypothetical protein NIES4101_57380 [Calothrix sp. NIES-4101]